MTNKPLPIGVDDFEKVICNHYYFVDKTLLIKELLDKKGDVNLFTRPRRFGKTLNMSMIQYFFEDGRDRNGKPVDNRSLFQNLKIMDCGEEYLQHMGKYPVIALSLKSAKQEDFEQSFAALMDDIAGEFVRHAFILESDCMTEYRKKKYRALMENGAERADYNKSLKFLSECLHCYYGRKAVILIDEYDVPLESAYFSNYYNKMSGFIRSLFESALKTNPHMEFAVITGCLRISKESVFTGLNNLKMISILDNRYDEYFGFTDAEVETICGDYGLEGKFGIFQKWYDGYLFGNANVYNPWSVIQYMDELKENKEAFPKSYWANTSSNDIVRRFIEFADRETRTEIEALIEGKTIEKPVHEDITYEEIYENMDNLWNFMFFTGYFRKTCERYDAAAGQIYLSLAIPNEEIRYIFRNKVMGWFHEQIKERDRTRLFHAFVQKDAQVVQEEIEPMLLKTISFNDAYESFYHGFLAGILYGMDGYMVKSNREGGKGRTDLFIKPVSRKKTAYVVEFKTAKNVEDLGNRAGDALQQIADKMYDRELLEDGYTAIVRYGISFCGKDCEVKICE